MRSWLRARFRLPSFDVRELVFPPNSEAGDGMGSLGGWLVLELELGMGIGNFRFGNETGCWVSGRGLTGCFRVTYSQEQQVPGRRGEAPFV